MARLLLVAATATALRPTITSRPQLTRRQAEPLTEARNALRGAAAAVEPQLKALEREVQDAKNAADAARRGGLPNVSFRLGEIEHLPVADATVDAIISNCVVNLSLNQPQVYR